MDLYPLKFYPIYKERIWGGEKLRKILNKDIVEGCRIGESWELTCRSHGDVSIVKNGIYEGLRLDELIEKYKFQIIGNAKMPKGKFPLLFKFIDAQDQLSIQVHPPDDYAELVKLDELGKTECWFIIDVEKGAELILGMRGLTTPKEVEKIVEEGRITEHINRIKVNKGDFIFLPAGTIHSIGKGVCLAEIQENSDVTYRIWDWGRKDQNGKPRETHVKQAINVLKINQDIQKLIKRDNLACEKGKTYIKKLTKNAFFSVLLYIVTSVVELKLKDKFSVLMVIQGSGKIFGRDFKEEIKKGDTVLLPSCLKSIKVEPYSKLFFLETIPG